MEQAKSNSNTRGRHLSTKPNSEARKDRQPQSLCHSKCDTKVSAESSKALEVPHLSELHLSVGKSLPCSSPSGDDDCVCEYECVCVMCACVGGYVKMYCSH